MAFDPVQYPVPVKDRSSMQIVLDSSGEANIIHAYSVAYASTSFNAHWGVAGEIDMIVTATLGRDCDSWIVSVGDGKKG